MAGRRKQDAPETQALRRRCALYASIWTELDGREPPALAAVFADLPERIEKASVRGLRSVERDFLEGMRGCTDVHGAPTEARRFVEERLQRELGLSLDSLLRGEASEVARILKRGRIR